MSQAPSNVGGTNYGAMFGTGFALGGVSAVATGIDAILGSREAKKRLLDYVAQEKANSLLATERLAREAQIALGATLNAMPEGQSVMETIASRIVAGAATDQFAIDEELRRRVRAAKAQMKNINTQVGQQVGSAFSGGFEAGVGLYQQKQELSHEQQLSQQYADAYRQQDEQSDIATETTRVASEAEKLEMLNLKGMYDELVEQNEALRSSPYVQSAFGRIFKPVIDRLSSMRFP